MAADSPNICCMSDEFAVDEIATASTDTGLITEGTKAEGKDLEGKETLTQWACSVHPDWLIKTQRTRINRLRDHVASLFQEFGEDRKNEGAQAAQNMLNDFRSGRIIREPNIVSEAIRRSGPNSTIRDKWDQVKSWRLVPGTFAVTCKSDVEIEDDSSARGW